MERMVETETCTRERHIEIERQGYLRQDNLYITWKTIKTINTSTSVFVHDDLDRHRETKKQRDRDA